MNDINNQDNINAQTVSGSKQQELTTTNGKNTALWIVVAIVAIAVIAMLLSGSSNNTTPMNPAPVQQAQTGTPSQGTTDESASIRSDLETTDIDGTSDAM